MKELEEYIQMIGTYQWNNKIWFSNLRFNGIFSINLDDFSLKLERIIPFLDICSYVPYVFCLGSGSKLFFFPNNCSEIMIFDMEIDAIQRIPISPMDGSNIFTTGGIICVNKQFWIFPKNIEQGIYMLDIENIRLNRSSQFDKLFKDIKMIDTVLELSEAKSAFLVNNCIWEIAINSKKIIYRKSFDSNLEILTMRYDGISYWVLFKNSTDVYQWNRTRNETTIYNLSGTAQEWIGRRRIPYSNIIFFQGKIVLLGYGLKYVMKVDKEKQLICKAIDYPAGFRFLHNIFYNSGWAAFSNFDIRGNKVWIYPLIGNMLLIYDIENNAIEGKKLTVTSQEYPLLHEFLINSTGRRFQEDESVSLLKMLILNRIDNEKDKKNDKKNVGKRIYDIVKN